MQYDIFFRQTSNQNAPAGNPAGGCILPGCMQMDSGGSKSGDHPLTQTIGTMKSPRKPNSNAMGTVRTGIPFTADQVHEDALPCFPKKEISDTSLPREIPLPEEESFRAFLNSRLSKHKASQTLKDRIRSSIEHTDI